ncbi:putative acetolactate synthase, large subunit, biosynthetic type [Leptospira ryugenii]|uniref:Acetolactate synthase n=1 Tax=Leptospira ryugenii TaxID=1917863 RepID=A0A2P2E0N7_9LEPT|nr:biosynthetic-type acetolactate synthase large subunit [Leptospira ryugenii]GBF50448.1 putative acetolactate synthase, large subunit, biosynthetic type [Leptospira ryugenii]
MPNKQTTVADYLIQFLEAKGIQYIPGVPGGTILPIYHSLANSRIQHVLARHEQGAGFIAQGIARSSQKTGVFFVSSGPGVANAITAVADAQRDSVPLLVVSGQVPTQLLGTDAFQELHTIEIVKSITKQAHLVLDAHSFPKILEDAFQATMDGKQGPVWIDIPKDIQMSALDFGPINEKKRHSHYFLTDSPNNSIEVAIQKTISLLNNCERPLLYFGGGARGVNTFPLIRDLSQKFQIPSVSTLMGLGIFGKKDPLYLGMMGMHGSTFANDALTHCDLLIALGVRFDDRATGNIDTFCPKAKVIHIDIDAREIGKNKKVDVSWKGDLSIFLECLLQNSINPKDISWIDHLLEEKAHSIQDAPLPSLFQQIYDCLNGEHFVLTDVGQHQMWVAQHFPFATPNSWITSGGQGTMGFGLPSSIGVALKNPSATVLCFTGDGSIMMNLQELACLKEWNLNVKLILMNNRHLGLVRQQQELFYENIRSGSEFNFQPNFCQLATSFGLEYVHCQLGEEYPFLSDWFARKGPSLWEIEIPTEEGVFPFVPAGKSNQEYILSVPRKS